MTELEALTKALSHLKQGMLILNDFYDDKPIIVETNHMLYNVQRTISGLKQQIEKVSAE